MSDDNDDRPLIRNEETLRRRAWIDSALAAVRGRLGPEEPGDSVAPAAGPALPEEPAAAAGGAGQRRLYLVRNSGAR